MGTESSEILIAVRALQDQIQQLSISIHRLVEVVENRQHSPRVPASVGGSPYRAASVASSSTSADYNRLALEIPLIPAVVLDLASSLRRSDSTERAERAWIIGYWARFVLAGRISRPRPSTPCGLSNTIYVIALTMTAVEQSVQDNGRWELAWQLTLLEDPPHQLWGYRGNNLNPRVRAFAPLCVQRWATVALAYMKEVDFIQSRRQDVTKKPQQPGAPSALPLYYL